MKTQTLCQHDPGISQRPNSQAGCVRHRKAEQAERQSGQPAAPPTPWLRPLTSPRPRALLRAGADGEFVLANSAPSAGGNRAGAGEHLQASNCKTEQRHQASLPRPPRSAPGSIWRCPRGPVALAWLWGHTCPPGHDHPGRLPRALCASTTPAPDWGGTPGRGTSRRFHLRPECARVPLWPADRSDPLLARRWSFGNGGTEGRTPACSRDTEHR